ncbi:hypothetical protein D5086_003926 [Populus alba]|uniref:Uncharacterized protein n=1 Tax=Populus alba TaxID=43335 RepID=A0ACC4D8H0_POPAL
MGAVFEKIVTYYDIRIIRLSLEALLSRMGKRRRFPDIEQDRDIQTREDKLGFCEKRNDLLKYTRSAERAIKYHNKKHKGAKFKLVEIISACSFFSMGVWEHINFTASEDDKSLKLFFAELSHGEAHWGRNHNTEAEKITACCLLEEGGLCISFVPSYARSGLVGCWFPSFWADKCLVTMLVCCGVCLGSCDCSSLLVKGLCIDQDGFLRIFIFCCVACFRVESAIIEDFRSTAGADSSLEK